MTQLVSGFFLVLLTFHAYAQQTHEVAAEPPLEVNDLAITIFALIFVGVCVVFAWMVWRNHKREQQKQGEARK